MLIILEGVDLAGKSTLAGQLADLACDLGMRVHQLHAGRPRGDALDEYELALHYGWRDAALDPHELVIADRWHLGERVYGPLLRGKTKLGAWQFMHVERYLDALGATRVVVETDDLAERHRRRGDDLLTLDQVIEVARWYRSAALRHRWRRVHSPATDEDVRTLLMWAGVDNERAQHTRDFPGYVGPSWPLVVLVGDEPNPNGAAGPVANPAFMPYRRNSGHFLLEAIDEAGISDWALANSGDGTDLSRLWEALDRPRVIALGRRAEARLIAASVPHVYAPHPQWARRFAHGAHGALHAYAGQLCSLATVPINLIA